MLRKTVVYFLVFFLSVLTLAFFFVPPYVVEITEAQIEEALEEHLPYTVNRGAAVTVQSAVVRLSDENKIIVDAQFVASGLTLEGTGTAKVASSVRYEDGQFYLSDLRHDDVSFAFSKNSESTLSEVRSAIEGILRRETEEADASQDPDRIGQLASANKYVETALREDALNVLDSVLASFPVYNLNRVDDSRFKVAALALDDVQITSEKVIVTLSLQRLIITLAGIVGTLFLAIFFFLGPQNSIRLSMFLARLIKGKGDTAER